MGIKLWLDDIRPAPEGWTQAFDVYKAKTYLKAGDVDYLSLDHDLGLEETGYDLVKWMAENNIWSKNKPSIHSANPVGRVNMQSVIDRYGPY